MSYFGYFSFSYDNTFRQGQSYSAVVMFGVVELQFQGSLTDAAKESSGHISKSNLIQGNKNNTPKIHFLSEKVPPVRKAQVGPSILRCLMKK